MIVTPKIFARLAAIAILAVLLQLSFFSRVELLHTSADILPAVVVSLGLNARWGRACSAWAPCAARPGSAR